MLGGPVYSIRCVHTGQCFTQARYSRHVHTLPCSLILMIMWCGGSSHKFNTCFAIHACLVAGQGKYVFLSLKEAITKIIHFNILIVYVFKCPNTICQHTCIEGGLLFRITLLIFKYNQNNI